MGKKKTRKAVRRAAIEKPSIIEKNPIFMGALRMFEADYVPEDGLEVLMKQLKEVSKVEEE